MTTNSSDAGTPGPGIAPETYHRIRLEERDGVTHVIVEGPRIDDEGLIQKLGEELAGLGRVHPGGRFILDFGGVEFASSTSMAKLLRFKALVEGSGGSILVCGLQSPLRDVFRTTNFDKLFQIHEGKYEDLGLR